jgi:hypothetical protein
VSGLAAVFAPDLLPGARNAIRTCLRVAPPERVTLITDRETDILQDEKIPGVHLAFGHPYSEHTGAAWSCPTHLDIVGRHFDVWMDGEPIMADGQFLISARVGVTRRRPPSA